MNGPNVFYGRMLESRVGALLEWHLHRKRRSKTQSLGAGLFPSQRELLFPHPTEPNKSVSLGLRMPKEGSFAAASSTERTLAH